MAVDASGSSRLAVTTSGKASAELIARARQAAQKWGLPFIERKRKAPLGAVFGPEAHALLVFGAEGLALRDREGALRFTPGMARLRVKRLDAGIQEDLLVRIAGFQAGETVVDCTLGLGADALVAARAVGATGRVVGLEKSLALYALVSDGLEQYDAGCRSCRIEPLHRDADSYLLSQPDGSFDHVLFDPMFERPRRSAPSFEMLRRFADHSPLTLSTLRQAARVARRSVVVKGARHSNDFSKLGLSAEPGSRYAPVLWARLAGDALRGARAALTCPTYRPEPSNPRCHRPAEER
jgi:16S rRNA (guanine1516-N2)-methyltransferase